LNLLIQYVASLSKLRTRLKPTFLSNAAASANLI
jgi:hypothetical protein